MNKPVFIFISIFILAIGIAGNFHSHLRPALDFDAFITDNDIITVPDPLDYIVSPDEKVINSIIKIDGIAFKERWEFDFLIDRKSIGDSVKVTYKEGNETRTATTLLVKAYGEKNKYILPFLLLLGMTFWVIGGYVFRSKPNDWAARVFYSTCMSVVVPIMIIWPGVPQNSDLSGYLLIFLYWLFYPLVPAFILYFTILYPDKKRILSRHQKLPVLIFSPCFVFILLIEGTFLYAVFTKELGSFHYFYYVYNYGFRTLFILYVALAVTNLVHSYIVSVTKDHRKKIQWILWGLLIGFFPFLFLWTLPQQLGFPPLIPEIVMYVFMAVIPLSIAVSIIKYQALNIEFIFEKSIIYIFTALFFLLLFILFISFTKFNYREIIINHRLKLNISIILSAVLFTPIVSQKILNRIRKYFSGIYNFPFIMKKFGSDLSSFHSQNNVVTYFFKEVKSIIPIEKIVLIFKSGPANTFEIVGSTGLKQSELKKLEKEITTGINSFVKQQYYEPDLEITKLAGLETKRGVPEIYKRSFGKLLYLPVYIIKKLWLFLFMPPVEKFPDFSNNIVSQKYDFRVFVPSYFHNELEGMTLVGEKTTKKEYSVDDIELINQMATEVFKTLERIRLQEAMILEQTEKKKLEELNQLKTDFISLISHELRSPLTSICWSVENLLDGIPEKPGPGTVEYLTGIYNNSRHLTSMIENLLDMTKIEAGKIEFYPEILALVESVNQAVETVKSVAENKSIHFENKVENNIRIKADKVFLNEILTNLLDNAIKYSNTGKRVRVEAKPVEKSDFVKISVIDQGIGISKENLSTIFDRFVRIKQETVNEKGLGLGLHIVKKLVELMGGSIHVESEPGTGSTFFVTLSGSVSL
ncbi:hypothetical protein JXQ31_16470 [candidate division KSB1 bacterium]|nr:hypothetical protein [candidate division KSB1 bacterium]